MSELKEIDGMAYELDGTAVQPIQKLEDGRFLVCAVYDNEDPMEPLLVDDKHPYIVGRLFKNPPTLKYSEEIATLQKELNELKTQKETAVQEAQTELARTRQMLEQVKKYKGLERLEAYIDKKIAYYVTYNGWSSLKIFTFEETKARGYTLKYNLLSLYGDSNGNLSWELYCSAKREGDSYTVFPCLTYDEAVAKAKEIILKRIADKHNDSWLEDAAKQYGIELPKEYLDSKNNQRIASCQEDIDNLTRRLDEAKKKLSELQPAA